MEIGMFGWVGGLPWLPKKDDFFWSGLLKQLFRKFIPWRFDKTRNYEARLQYALPACSYSISAIVVVDQSMLIISFSS